MTDVAMRTGDQTLLDACRTLFDSVTQRRMYLIGGCGSTAIGEAFTVDYDLPNDTAYAESCASMAFAQFARRMADATGEARYADAMEQSLYNGCLSGISLDGDRFFYANLLTVDDANFLHGHIAAERQPWFDCSCCPTSYRGSTAPAARRVTAASCRSSPASPGRSAKGNCAATSRRPEPSRATA